MKLGQGEGGYAMAALLVGLSIMAVLMSAALPVWSHFSRREKEEELIWRGQQYSRAIGLFQRKYANTFPPNVDVLVEQRFLRKKYKDPITNDEFQAIPATGMPAGATAPPGATPTPRAPLGAPPGATTGAPPTPGARPPTTAGGPGGGPPLSQPAGRGGLGAGSFQPSIGIQGVVSKSKDASIKVFNGRTKYNEWLFIYLSSSQRLGGPGAPGAGGGPVGPGGGPGGGPGSFERGGSTFTPLGGSDRRPGVGPGGPGGGAGQQPFGQPPFGQPPNGQPPFGRPPSPGQPPRPPRG